MYNFAITHGGAISGSRHDQGISQSKPRSKSLLVLAGFGVTINGSAVLEGSIGGRGRLGSGGVPARKEYDEIPPGSTVLGRGWLLAVVVAQFRLQYTRDICTPHTGAGTVVGVCRDPALSVQLCTLPRRVDGVDANHDCWLLASSKDLLQAFFSTGMSRSLSLGVCDYQNHPRSCTFSHSYKSIEDCQVR